jgi:hypothetical protein
MNKRLTMGAMLLIMVSSLVWSGVNVKSQEDAAGTNKVSVMRPVTVGQPQEGGKTKPNKCQKCLSWELRCVEKNDKGECIRWKYVCTQWETYPC